MNTVSMPSSSATRQACCPPAPPKHCRAKRAASWPFCSETCLIALAMLATAMRRKPSAAARGSCPARSAANARPRTARVQRLVAVRAEDGGEMRRLDLADHDVGVGDRQRPAAAVAGRAGIGARAVRPDAEARAVEMQQRAAARRDRVDRHHRRPDAHAGDLGLERTLERAVVQRHVGAGAAHVEADDAVEPGRLRGARRADDAARRPGQDRVLAAERGGVRQAAVGLHEIQLHAGQLAATWST